MRSLPLALLLPVLLAGCTGGPQGGALAGSIEFETVDQGVDSGIHDRRMLAILTRPEWETFWGAHASYQIPPSAPPGVDFSQRMVVAVFKGTSPDSCHWAEISRIGQDVAKNVMTVEGDWITVTGGVCAARLTYPFHMVHLERGDGEVRFEMRDVTRPAE